MFADAYQLARQYTLPVIVSVRFWDGAVESGCGAFVVLNKEGWIVTAAHLWKPQFAHKEHAPHLTEYKKAVVQIESNIHLRPKQKKKQVAKLRPNPKWITNVSFWWAADGIQLKDIKVLKSADLVVGRLDPFNEKRVSCYPVLKDPGRGIRPGTSLCRLGYPFYKIKASFEDGKGFILPEGTLPLPLFPLEGIFTRNIFIGKSEGDSYEIKFFETSSPGLRGQSGGPVFDVRGTVWGIQSQTVHHELGFSPKVRRNRMEVEENQFLNVGWAVHPETLVGFLRKSGIGFQLSDY